jgi:hypothetical protein
MGRGPVQGNPDLYIRTQASRAITANPAGSREERRAAKKLGVVPESGWARFAPDKNDNEETE